MYIYDQRKSCQRLEDRNCARHMWRRRRNITCLSEAEGRTSQRSIHYEHAAGAPQITDYARCVAKRSQNG